MSASVASASASGSGGGDGGVSRTGEPIVSVRGVQAANILPAGVTRKRQQLSAPGSSKDNGRAGGGGAPSRPGRNPRNALLAAATAQHTPAVAEFRAYPYPPPAHPIAYPASEPPPDPRFYTSPFDDAAERERKRKALPVRNRIIRRFESERGPLAPPKKRVSSTSVAVAAASAAAASITAAAAASGAASALGAAAGAGTSGLHVLDGDGFPYDMTNLGCAPASSNVKPSLPQRGRPRKRPLSAAVISAPSKRRPTARHVNANAWWKRPVRATTPDPSTSTPLQTTPVTVKQQSPYYSLPPLPAPEAMPALPPLPDLYPIQPLQGVLPALAEKIAAFSRAKREDSTVSAAKRRPRANPSPSLSRASTPTMKAKDTSGHTTSESGEVSPSLPPGSTVTVRGTPPAPACMPLLNVDAAARDASTQKQSAVARGAGLNAAMFAAPQSQAVNQGALMNKAMFGSSMRAGMMVDSTVGKSYELQCAIDSMRVERHRLWTHEMQELENRARMRLAETLRRGEFAMDEQFRRDLRTRLCRAGKETQTLVRQVIDESVGEVSVSLDSGAQIDDQSLDSVLKLDDVRLTMLSLLLELETHPTDEYWKVRKKQKLLATKIGRIRKELDRIASISQNAPVAAGPAGYALPSAYRA
jgi:hypothetical protein